MRVTTSKSKNSESFYITKSYTNAEGRVLPPQSKNWVLWPNYRNVLAPTGMVSWHGQKNKQESKQKNIKKKQKMQLLRFPSIPTGLWTITEKKLFTGGYLFLQSVYYGLKMDSICRKIRYRYKFKYDLNAILSDLIYTRVLEPSSKLLLQGCTAIPGGTNL